MLPTITWDVDPVVATLSRGSVVIAFGVLAAAALVHAIVRKAADELLVAAGFAALALGVARLMTGAYTITWYGLLFALVFVGGWALFRAQVVRGGGSPGDASAFVAYGVLGVLVGARLGHVLFYQPARALEDPAWVLDVRDGGLASHGAVVGLVVAMLVFTRRRGVAFLEGADRFALSAALGATLVRVGNLMNSEVVGRPTDGTWGFRFPRHDRGAGADVLLRHPSQLYEIGLGLAVMGSLVVADRLLGRERRPRGAMIAWFFAAYFTGRFAVEVFKEPAGASPIPWLTLGQVLSVPGILIGWAGLAWALSTRVPAGWRRTGRGARRAPEEEARAGRRGRGNRWLPRSRC